MFYGWEWGSTQDGVCVIDDDGAIVQQWLVGHIDDELKTLIPSLTALAIRVGCRSRSNGERG